MTVKLAVEVQWAVVASAESIFGKVIALLGVFSTQVQAKEFAKKRAEVSGLDVKEYSIVEVDVNPDP